MGIIHRRMAAGAAGIGIAVGIPGHGGDKAPAIGAGARQAVWIIASQRADGAAGGRINRALCGMMLGVIVGMAQVAQGVGYLGEAVEGIVGEGRIFAEGIGGLGQVMVAVIKKGGGMVARINHLDGVILAVKAVAAPRP